MANPDKDIERIAQTIEGITREVSADRSQSFSAAWDEAHAMERRREERKAQHRRDFPAMAKFSDHFAKKFGPVRVIYAEEGGRRIGKECRGDE